MYCRKCGKQIPDDSNVCQYCGVRTMLNEDGLSSLQDSQNSSQVGPSQDAADVVDKQTVDVATDSIQEQIKSNEPAARSGAAEAPKPKSKTIAIVAAAAVVVVIAAIIGMFAVGGQGASGSGGSAGNTRSEPIVGEWKVAAVSTGDDGMSSFTSGGATVKGDGSVSVNLTGGSGLKMSGTWKAESKTNWPDVDDLVGYYEVSLTVEGTKGGFTGAVTKSGSEYTLFLMLTSDPDTSMVFTRSA